VRFSPHLLPADVGNVLRFQSPGVKSSSPTAAVVLDQSKASHACCGS
jgi:hypothetical protein